MDNVNHTGTNVRLKIDRFSISKLLVIQRSTNGERLVDVDEDNTDGVREVENEIIKVVSSLARELGRGGETREGGLII